MKLSELSTSQMAILGAEKTEDLLTNSSNAIWYKEDITSSPKKTYKVDGFDTVKKFNSDKETVRVSLNNKQSHMGVKAYAKALASANALDKDVKSLTFSTKQVENPGEFESFTANPGEENEQVYVAHEIVDLIIK